MTKSAAFFTIDAIGKGFLAVSAHPAQCGNAAHSLKVIHFYSLLWSYTFQNIQYMFYNQANRNLLLESFSYHLLGY